jgi:hypothetical protein
MTRKDLLTKNESQQNHKWRNGYPTEITSRFLREQFEKGKLHGQYPENFENENIGHGMPCAAYHIGYVTGRHERLLKDQKIPSNKWEDWVLVAVVKDIRFPLSSPAEYYLVEEKRSLPGS